MVFTGPQKFDKRLANFRWVGKQLISMYRTGSISLGEYYPYFSKKVSMMVFCRTTVHASLISYVPSQMTVSSESKKLVYLLGDKLHGK